MSALRPNQLAFRGRVEVAGLLLDDTVEGRRRVLRQWSPGTSIERTARGLLLRFASARALRCESAIGTPLIVQHGVWSAVPLTKDEAKDLAHGAVFVARAGILEHVASAGPSPEPSEWIDVSAFVVAEAEALVDPPARIAVALDPRGIDLRARMKDPKLSQALLETLREAGAVRPRSLGRSLLGWFGRLLRGAPPPDPGNSLPVKQGPFDRFNDWLSSKLERTAAGRWLIDRQSAYIDRLLKMFDQNDLDAALRHAIALEGNALTGGGGRALGTPSPRSNLGLTFGFGRGVGGPAMQLEANRYEQLRNQYRAAAKKLEAEGRFEEAAFVLTDLLNAPLDAVALLERNGKFTLAAQLAEGKSLEPALQVRLWFLAGDTARAVRVARKTKTFGPAVAKLEATHPAEAGTLRMLWAESLASSGDFAGAVRAAWPVADARALLLRWIDIGIEAGGPEAARLSLLRLDLDPENAAPTMSRVLTLLGDHSMELALDREALGEALLTGAEASQPFRKLLGRPAARALIRDRAAFGSKSEPLLKRLLALDEGALRTDLPHVAPPPPRQRPTGFVFHADPSALIAHDAAFLPGGRTLLALGENGLRVVSADGRTVWHSDAPAFSLALAPTGLFALTITPRGQSAAVGRISLGIRQAETWGRLPITTAATEVHGALWYVASSGAVLALDSLSTPPAALWQFPATDLVRAIGVDDTGVALLVENPLTGVQLLQFLSPRNLPQPIGPQWQPPGDIRYSAAIVNGFACVGSNETHRPFVWHLAPGAGQVAAHVLDGEPAGPPALTASHLAVSMQVAGGTDVRVTPGELRLHFEGAHQVALRWQGSILVCAADNGRVVCFDVASSAVVRQLSAKAGR